MDKLVALTLAVAFFAVSAAAASAQYPPPAGSLVATTSATTASAGASVQVTCRLTDTSGIALAARTVGFDILQQPGASAALSTPFALSDNNGRAGVDLYVGTTPGTIIVGCSSGDLRSNVVVEVLGVVAVQPPSTGDAGLRDERGLSPLIVIVAVAASVTGLGVVGRRSHTSS